MYVCVCVCLTLDIARKTKRNERNNFTFQRNYLRRDERKYIELLPLPLPLPLPGDGDVRGVWWSIAWHYLSAARQREARSYSEAVAADGRTTSARTLEWVIVIYFCNCESVKRTHTHTRARTHCVNHIANDKQSELNRKQKEKMLIKRRQMQSAVQKLNGSW